MFKVLVFVCSVHLSSADCQFHTAVQVIDGPEVANEAMCGMAGQAFYAGSGLAGDQRADEYLKITCTRSSMGRTNVG